MAGAVLAHMCPALGPRVAPLLTAPRLLVAALDLLSTDKSVLKPVWDFSPCALCKDVTGKARKLQLHLPNLR